MELAVPSFVFTPGRNFRERTASGPLDSWIQANPVAAHRPPGYARRRLRLVFESRLSNNFGDFRWSKFSNHKPLSPVLKDQKLFLSHAGRVPLIGGSIPEEFTVCSSKGQALQFAYGLEILRHPSLSALDGVSIEGKK